MAERPRACSTGRVLVWLVAASWLASSAASALPTVQLKTRTFEPVPGLSALDPAAYGAGESRHFFVQLGHPVQEMEKTDLAERGVRLLEYIPDQTWVASITRDAASDPAIRALLVWVGEILPSDKLPETFSQSGFGSWTLDGMGRADVRVRLHADADAAASRLLLQRAGAEIVAPLAIFKGFRVRVPVDHAELVASLDVVSSVRGLPPALALQNDSNRARVSADALQASPYNLTGLGINFGVWDGGRADLNHDDFAGRIQTGEGGTAVNLHATHVTGTVGGSGALSQSRGGSPLQWRGMAPEVSIITWDFGGDVPAEIFDGSTAFSLDVENNSWAWGVDGGNCDLYGNYEAWAPEFDELVRGSSGRTFTVCFAATNERDDGDCSLIGGQYACIPPPCTAKNVITVGATNSNNDSMTGFSSWGPVDDGRLKPDVCAPGCQQGGDGGVTSTVPGDNYDDLCGTSMATPTATGCSALLRQLYGALNGSARPQPSLIKAILVDTALDLGNAGPDYAFGHGRINAQAAADALIDDSQVVLPLTQEAIAEIGFMVPSGLPELRFVAVWDDPAASELANPTLVNNVDFALVDPNGVSHLPWVLNPSDPSALATQAVDNRNNVEHVAVSAPMAGLWRAQVRGTNIPSGPQTVSIAGLDQRRPARPASFEVVGSTDTSLDLVWERASNSDRRGTLIVRTTSPLLWPGPPAGSSFVVGQEAAPGIFVAFVGDEDHSSTPFTDAGLAGGVRYNYGAYTFDDFHNYSIPANASGTTGGSVDVTQVDAGVVPFALRGALPNPARARTTIGFSLEDTGAARLAIYDAAGRHVRTLVSQDLTPGRYEVAWDGRDASNVPVSPGVYYAVLRSATKQATARVVWLR